MSATGHSPWSLLRLPQLLVMTMFTLATISSATLTLGDFVSWQLLDMYPVDPTIEEGQALNLTCVILPRYNGSYDSRDMCFMHNNQRHCEEHELVTVLDSRTAVFYRQNISVTDNGHYYCKLPDMTSVMQYGTTSVHVLRKPIQPTIVGCTAWDQLVCRWSPSVNKQINFTSSQSFRQTLTWSQGTRTDSVTCTLKKNLDSDSCQDLGDLSILNATVPHLNEPFCVTASAWTLVNVTISSAPWCSNVADILKPKKLSQPTVTVVNSTHAVVNLTAPALTVACPRDTTFIYSFNYTSQWSQNSTLLVRNSGPFTFSTKPFTWYNGSVAVKSATYGLWSDPIELERFQSSPDVPLQSPATDPAAVFVTSGDQRRVFIYWKKLRKQDEHGPNFKYVIQRRQSEAGNWQDAQDTVNADLSWGKAWVGVHPVDLTVISRNSVGSTAPSTVLHIPSANASIMAANIVDVVAEHRGSVIVVTWSCDIADVSTFTLLWCQSHTSAETCDSDIEWVKLSPTTHEHNISVSEDGDVKYIVGVAVTVDSGLTSGVHWADCIHSIDAEASPPDSVKAVAPTEHASHGQLLVTWTHPPCLATEGHIVAYQLHYCPLDDDKQCIGEAAVVAVSSRASSYNLTELQSGALYSVQLCSVTRRGPSSLCAKAVAVRTTTPWLTAAAIIGICFGAIIFILLALCVIWASYRRCSKCRRQFMGGLQIRVPETYMKPPTAEAGDTSYFSYTEPPVRNLQSNGGSEIYQPLLPRSTAPPRDPPCSSDHTMPVDRYINVPPTAAAASSGSAAFHQPSPHDNCTDIEGTVELQIAMTPSLASCPPSTSPPPPQEPTVLEAPVMTAALPSTLENTDVMNGGYLVAGPETFGCLDVLTMHPPPRLEAALPKAESLSSRVGTTSPPPSSNVPSLPLAPARDSSYTDLSLAMGKQSPIDGYAATAVDDIDFTDDERRPNRTDNADTTDDRREQEADVPMSKYTVIVGVGNVADSCGSLHPAPSSNTDSGIGVDSVLAAPKKTDDAAEGGPSVVFPPNNNVAVLANPNNGYMSFTELTAAIGM